MGLRLFADHCVSQSTVRRFRAAGHEVLLLREHLARNATDGAVIAQAQQLEAILVTINGDFSDIVAYPPSRFGGIMALQVKNRPSVLGPMMDRLLAFIEDHPNQDEYRGVLLLVEAHRIRVRR
ncbi:MAG: DUF5615 family PIN-like protein [Bacteroidota bacterium]